LLLSFIVWYGFLMLFSVHGGTWPSAAVKRSARCRLGCLVDCLLCGARGGGGEASRASPAREAEAGTHVPAVDRGDVGCRGARAGSLVVKFQLAFCGSGGSESWSESESACGGFESGGPCGLGTSQQRGPPAAWQARPSWIPLAPRFPPKLTKNTQTNTHTHNKTTKKHNQQKNKHKTHTNTKT